MGVPRRQGGRGRAPGAGPCPRAGRRTGHARRALPAVHDRAPSLPGPARDAAFPRSNRLHRRAPRPRRPTGGVGAAAGTQQPPVPRRQPAGGHRPEVTAPAGHTPRRAQPPGRACRYRPPRPGQPGPLPAAMVAKRGSPRARRPLPGARRPLLDPRRRPPRHPRTRFRPSPDWWKRAFARAGPDGSGPCGSGPRPRKGAKRPAGSQRPEI